MNIQPGMIPPELRALRQWVVWKTVTRDDRPTKVPYTPRTGLPARTHNSEGKTYSDLPSDTWGAFDEAVASVRRSKTWNGIGFVFTADDPYCGIDLDHAAPSGRPTKEANEIIRLLDSYTERSPSGEGLHIIVRAFLPPGGRRHGFIEMYDQGRYFTVTGDTLAGHVAIQDRQEQVERLHATIWQPEPPRRFALPKPTAANGDILDKARNAANGEKFRSLYDHGLVHLYDDDDSRADLACCSILAFWYQGDQSAVDRAFRGSALYRSKWDERHGARTYGERTVERACLTKTEFYTPNGRADNRTNGSTRVDAETGEIVEPEPDLRPTESGSADRVIAAYGGELRHAYNENLWWTWAGNRWAPRSEARAIGLVEQVMRALYDDARATAEDDEKRKALVKYALRTESNRYLRSVLEIMRHRPSLAALPSDFDADPMLLNCPNGTVNLRNGCLQEHRKTDLLSRLTTTTYDPAALSPLWERFVSRVLPDPDVRDFMQRACGYALTGDTSEQCFFFLHGDGSNGKSTCIAALLAVLGEYGMQALPDLLLAQKGDRAALGIAELEGRRFVATIEVDEGKRLAEGLVKQMTGGDRLKGKFLYRNPFEFDPTHKIFMAANHKPTIHGTDHAIWRRIMLVPFTERIRDEEKDIHLLAKLKQELPAILNWCVQGCLSWRTVGLKPPAAVLAATEEYRSEQDIIGQFIAENCRRSGSVEGGRLYEAYKSWCITNGEKPLPQQAFGRDLTRKGFGRNTARHGRSHRTGISLVGEDLDI